MAKARVKHPAAVGVAEHGNSAVLVTIAANGILLDRRRIDLTRGLPTYPYHHEGSWAIGRYADSSWAKPISLPDAVALVKRVHEAAARATMHSTSWPLHSLCRSRISQSAFAQSCHRRLRNELPTVTRRAWRTPSCIARRLREQPKRGGWRVFWYDRERVFRDAKAAIGGKDVDILLRAMGRSAGAPWQAIHKLAAAAAPAASLRG